MSIRTFVNKEGTVMVQLMTVAQDDQTTALVHVATRDHFDYAWSPPIVLREERS